VPRRPTATSSFGSGRRESHDASGFYRRFPLPAICSDDDVAPPSVIDRLFVGDARSMSEEQVADRSVALVVTSPPYFTGKE
jgi:site-specific DNA-methyltransferase (adenine-specific)